MLTAASRSHNQAAAAAERQQQQEQQQRSSSSSSYNKLLNKNARARTQWKSYAKYSAKKWNTHTDNKGERKKLKRTVFASQAMKESQLWPSEATKRKYQSAELSRSLSLLLLLFIFLLSALRSRRDVVARRCYTRVLRVHVSICVGQCVCVWMCVAVAHAFWRQWNATSILAGKQEAFKHERS